MKTNIGIVYFNESLTKDRSHHTVTDMLLNTWTHFYINSNTHMKPFLLMDATTKAPPNWRYGIVRVTDPEPPTRIDVLHKVGWIKSQGFKELGRCLIMDLDCFIMQSLDHLDDLDAPMAMPVDPSKRTYEQWKEVGEELNAGLILQNSSTILTRFKELWEEKKSFFSITYYDELIFSAICRELQGTILPEIYNTSWKNGDENDLKEKENNPENIILHFHGHRKTQLPNFLKRKNICDLPSSSWDIPML